MHVSTEATLKKKTVPSRRRTRRLGLSLPVPSLPMPVPSLPMPVLTLPMPVLTLPMPVPSLPMPVLTLPMPVLSLLCALCVLLAFSPVIPAQAGIQKKHWTPACAGVTYLRAGVT